MLDEGGAVREVESDEGPYDSDGRRRQLTRDDLARVRHDGRPHKEGGLAVVHRHSFTLAVCVCVCVVWNMIF